MKGCERWSFNLLALAVSVSGIVLFVTKYFVENPDPFSIVNHPLQPIALDVHVFTSPFFLLLAGMLFAGHARYKRRKRRKDNRLTGNLLQWLIILMAFSGYGLQIVASGRANRVLLVLHLASSTVFLVAFIVHAYVSVVMRRRRQRDGCESVERLAA